MRRPKQRRGRLGRLLRVMAVLGVLAVGVVIAVDVHVVHSTRDRVWTWQAAPRHAVIVVLGASVLRDGTPSPMLADRLAAAAALWHAGKAPQILVSGDRDAAAEYDETQPMHDELVGLGVDPAAILIDPRGYRTLDSMARVREVFGFDDALVVTNDFHVPRAVYLGRAFGIDVDGVIADPDADRPIGSVTRNVGREVLARVLAFVDVELLGTRPPADPDSER